MASWPRGSEEALAERGTDRQVADDEGLAELRSRRDEVAVVVEDHGGAVEDQLVLSADKVDVSERARCIGGPCSEHAFPLGEDAGTVRGRVDRYDELGAPLAKAAHRPHGAPCVLADSHTYADAADHKERVPAGPRNEVALLVEDAVVGEQLFAHDARTWPSAHTAAAL